MLTASVFSQASESKKSAHVSFGEFGSHSKVSSDHGFSSKC